MSATPARQAVIVGLFVLLGAALFAGGVATVGSLGGTFRRTAVVHAVFDDVRGLDVASDVRFSGVEVGTVRGVRFDRGPSVAVELAVAREAMAHIPADAQAKITSDALLGEPIVELFGGTAGGPVLSDGQALQAVTTPTTEELFETLQQNSENLLAVTEDLRVITRSLASGQGTAGKLLADDRLYDDLRAGASSLQGASAEARTLVGTLAGFAEELDREGTSASLARSAQHLEEVTAGASSLTSTLEERLSSPRGAVGVLLSDEEAAADLKKTIDELERGSRLLSEDLEALQHNFLLRGFFRKRERERAAEEPPEPAEPAEPPPVSVREPQS